MFAAAIVIGCWAPVAHALHRDTLGAVQVTSGVSHDQTTGRGWGNYVAFSSSQDLARLGAARHPGPQIFVFNIAYYDCDRGTTLPTTPCPPAGTPYLVQVTNGPGAPANPSVARVQTLADGVTPVAQWVAFDALGVFGGLTGPAASRRQVFMVDMVTGSIVPVTTASDGNSTNPSVSSIAGVVVFQSTAALGGFQNPAGATQAYIWQRPNTIRRLSTAVLGRAGECPAGSCAGRGASTNVTVNENGTRVVFQSTSALMSDGTDTGTSQVFYATYDKPSATATLYRLTNGNGASQHPFIAETAPRVVFDSAATNLPGSLGGPGKRIVSADITNPSAPVLVQHTLPSTYGDCTYPTLDPGGNRIAMLCMGDPLANGTSGRRAFIINTQTSSLYQITSTGDVQPPLHANLGLNFLTVATESDLVGLGACGRQIYVINYNFEDNPNRSWVPATQVGQLPPDMLPPDLSGVIGLRNFEIRAQGEIDGSETILTTQAGSTATPVTVNGSIGLEIGAPNFSGEIDVAVPRVRASFPPVPVPFGAICFKSAGNGAGKIDCNGGLAGGDLSVSQDHSTRGDGDLSCNLGCAEDAACQGALTGPHTPCGFCNPSTLVCAGGPFSGVPCSSDVQCQHPSCVQAPQSVCNGPVVTDLSSPMDPGGARLLLPVEFSFSTFRGLDGVFCTADDSYSPVQNVPANLWLTTGAVTGTIHDAENTPGAQITTSDVGSPFSCGLLQASEMTGARLVGVLPILDVPSVPTLHDVLITFSFEASPGNPNGCGASCLVDANCDDNNACNGVEVCGAGFQCVAGEPVVCPDDGNACNGVEVCNVLTGACEATALNCNDGNPCTDDSCSMGTGCVHTNNTNSCNDGSLCTELDQCSGGVCVGQPTAIALGCDDDDACNGVETCNPATGTCVNPPDLDCDDDNVCTTDSCNPASGCVNSANTLSCNDQSACTENDQCSGGACVGTPTQVALGCNDGDVCDGLETCNPATGQCEEGTPPDCEDENPCTDGFCGVNGCFQVNNTASCSDGNACTAGDVCTAGACTSGGLIQCSDGDPCNGLETCDPESGCLPGTPLDCDDDNPCTDDFCGPQGCFHVNTTASCNDGNPCTTNDACFLGACRGGALLQCSDGDPCNGVETCNPTGGCQAGTPLSCDDDNGCTEDSCEPGVGCAHVDLDATACDDGDACTTGDVCSAGTCGGEAVVCGDANVCNGQESCNPSTGVCEAGTPLTCDDGDACTIDNACDPQGGCIFTRVPNFIVCRLASLNDAVAAANPADLGGRARQKDLRQRVNGARKRAQAALTGNPAATLRNLRKAGRKMGGFMQKLQKGVLRGKVEPDLGNKLLAMAVDSEAELTQLIRSASR